MIFFSLPDERQGNDYGRGAGIRDPAVDVRKAAFRSGREDHRSSGGLVLRSPVHRLEGRPHLGEALPKGKSSFSFLCMLSVLVVR